VTGKLVRDRIPEIIRQSGGVPLVLRLDAAQYVAALRAKLVEEATEAHNAVTGEHLLEELADVLEVVLALATAAGARFDDVAELARAKREARGGFSKRYWLDSSR
jgi:predicted house-cleaning noncanonical NTP pyrophosphatase (MazG superfamily)